jgi:hypothetical protein
MVSLKLPALLLIAGFCSSIGIFHVLQYQTRLAMNEAVTSLRVAPPSSKNGTVVVTTTPPQWPRPPGYPVKSLDYDPHWLLISKTKNVAITYVPKVMCSSLKFAFNTLESCANRMKGCAEERYNEALQNVDISNMTRVIMFRDPFERAYSAYTNSEFNGGIKLQHCKNKTMCTFDEWVDEIADNTEHAFYNGHFKPMVKIAQLDKMHYDYYLRLSSPVDQDFLWRSLLKQETGKTEKNKSHKEENGTSTLFEKLKTNNTIHKLAEIYKDDLKLWREMLEHGTPREEGTEITVYDFYMEMVHTSNRNN